MSVLYKFMSFMNATDPEDDPDVYNDEYDEDIDHGPQEEVLTPDNKIRTFGGPRTTAKGKGKMASHQHGDPNWNYYSIWYSNGFDSENKIPCYLSKRRHQTFKSFKYKQMVIWSLWRFE